jgi:predicted NAD/FAD-dependent oxidoreductase
MRLVVVGAGVSGLAAAHTLAAIAPQIAVHIVEKSRGLGGRAATRRRDGARFDHGAQFFRPVDAAQRAFFTQTLPHDALIDITKPVHAFDRENRITVGDSVQNNEPKYVYRDGINTLGKLLTPSTVTLSLQTQIQRIQVMSAGYAVIDATGQTVATADGLLFTPPAPQTMALLQASTIDESVKNALQNGLAPATYRPCLSVSLLYPGVFDPEYYALVNTDRGHAISWLAVEHAKDVTRVPEGHTLLTAQLAPHASREHWDTAEPSLFRTVAEWVQALTGHTLGEPLWGDRHGWRFALPDGRADERVMQAYEQSHGLYFAGDAHTGLGRIQLAIAHGQTVARRIAAHAGVRI